MKPTMLMSSVLFSLAASLAGCASTRAEGPAPQTASSITADGTHRQCPMPVPGTQVSERDVEGGAALVFTSTSDQLSRLRENARNIANVYNYRDTGEAIDAPSKPQLAPTDTYIAMPQVDVTLAETADGAKILLHPKDPAHLATVRARANIDASRISQGQCITL